MLHSPSIILITLQVRFDAFCKMPLPRLNMTTWLQQNQDSGSLSSTAKQLLNSWADRPLFQLDRHDFKNTVSHEIYHVTLWQAGDPVKMLISFQLRGFEGLTLELSWVEEYCLDKYYELKSSCRLFTGLKFTINTYVIHRLR